LQTDSAAVADPRYVKPTCHPRAQTPRKDIPKEDGVYQWIKVDSLACIAG
jgi:hypothetical protein